MNAMVASVRSPTALLLPTRSPRVRFTANAYLSKDIYSRSPRGAARQRAPTHRRRERGRRCGRRGHAFHGARSGARSGARGAPPRTHHRLPVRAQIRNEKGKPRPIVPSAGRELHRPANGSHSLVSEDFATRTRHRSASRRRRCDRYRYGQARKIGVRRESHAPTPRRQQKCSWGASTALQIVCAWQQACSVSCMPDEPRRSERLPRRRARWVWVHSVHRCSLALALQQHPIPHTHAVVVDHTLADIASPSRSTALASIQHARSHN